MKRTRKNKHILLLLCILVISLSNLQSQTWYPTSGPSGGDIPNMALHPTDSAIMFSVGRSDGIYKTQNYGTSWELIPFDIELNEPIKNILVNPSNPDIIICSSNNDLIKTSNGGENWKLLSSGFNPDTKYTHVLISDPLDSETLYTAGGSHNPSVSASVYMSDDYGESWTNIGSGLTLPTGVFINAVCALGNGKLLIGVNDVGLESWGKGKVFYSPNNGASWDEIDYGQYEDRFIWSIHANAYDLSKVWISEGSIYNTGLDQPFLYLSANSGLNWDAKTYNNESFDGSQMRVIGSSKLATNVYIASGGNLYVTRDNGTTLEEITCPQEILRFDLFNVYEQINNTNKIFLPTGANGIAFSPDGGVSWGLINKGILNTSINLLSVDPNNPSIVYAASSKGEGLFKSTNYGETWEILNQNGIVHQWADELIIDPTNSANVWYVSDVPYIHKTENSGENWVLTNNPYSPDNFSFSSVYAVAQANDDNIIYAANNGFGLYKGTKQWPDESYHWSFLNTSDIDYTYTIAVEPDNENILYSGYSKKPFEDTTMIRASYDGGNEWFTSLKVADAEAITSIEIDPLNKDKIIAASVGKEGILWLSNDKGQNWDTLNSLFNFTNIHSFAVHDNTAYAATWGGGMYKTNTGGEVWGKLESNESFSASAVAIVNNGMEELYVADRAKPFLYKSIDGGLSWDTIFDAGPDYRRLMGIDIDKQNTSRLYVSAMKAQGAGLTGDLFSLENSTSEIITNELPRLPLTIRVSPSNSNLLYAVLHESGVYKSTNKGESWSEISDVSRGLPNCGFNDLVIDPNNSDMLYLLGGSDIRFSTIASAGIEPDSVMAVYKSANNGESWEKINNNVFGENSGNIKSMSFYNNSSNHIYLAAENGVFYTTDGGINWTEEPDLFYKTLSGLAISADTVYAFTLGAGVITGIINGDFTITWDAKVGFKNEIAFAQILKHPVEASILFASAYPGGIFKSYDYGETWHERNFGIPSFKVNDPLREGYYALDINQDNPEIMYLGLYKKGVYRSFNGGDTWYPVNGSNWEMGVAPITCLVSDVSDENIVYVGTLDGLYKTSDGGNTWEEFNNGMGKKEIRSINMNVNGNLHVGTKGNGLYTLFEDSWIPNNGFGNWGISWPMWDNRPMYQYTSLLIHPENNQRMIMGTFPQGIYISTDEGTSWKESNIGWTNDGVFRLVCHPNNPEIVYAGTYNGINISYDFGQSWQMSDNGWPDEQWVFSIDFDPVNPDIMYACSKNGENEGVGVEDFHGTVMKSTNGGVTWFEITNGLDLGQEFYQIICDKSTSGVLYLACQYDGVYRSSDGGINWNPFNDGLSQIRPGTNGNNVTNTLVLSEDNSVLYYGTAGSGVFRSLLVSILSAQDLRAAQVGENIKLDWQFTNITENFNSFKIYRSNEEITDILEASLIQTILGADTLSYIDTNVVEGEIYYYAVTVVSDEAYETEKYPTVGPVSITLDNKPPELVIPLEDQNIKANESFVYDIPNGSFVDPDDDELLYTAFEVGENSLPDWLIFDNANLSFYGTPTTNDIGQADIEMIVSDPYDASAVDTFKITIDNAVGISIKNKENIQIYPNPASSYISIASFSDNMEYTVVMYDLFSKKALSNKDFSVYTYQNKLQIDISSLNDGIYIVVVKNKSIEIVRKIIIQH